MTTFTKYQDVHAFVTKDGSLIRELMHPATHGNQNQSFAEASVPPGITTYLHRHRLGEEIYHITAGCGVMTLGDQSFEVTIGDTVCIPPGTAHNIRNTGSDDLRILCACSPPYAHADTELLDD
jgi:mannose-6-phosphate isomerase-like protein (cupin superfamily)